MKEQKNITPPMPTDTVLWLRLTFEELKDIKPGSKLAKRILHEAVAYESAWRPAYINAVERNVINPAMQIDDDAAITEPTTLDDEDGAYVMCWQFIPHSSVIPPSPTPTPQETNRMAGRLREIANNLDVK